MNDLDGDNFLPSFLLLLRNTRSSLVSAFLCLCLRYAMLRLLCHVSFFDFCAQYLSDLIFSSHSQPVYETVRLSWIFYSLLYVHIQFIRYIPFHFYSSTPLSDQAPPVYQSINQLLTIRQPPSPRYTTQHLKSETIPYPA